MGGWPVDVISCDWIQIPFIDNEPNASLDADAIAQQLEPEGLVQDYVFVDAAISELSDRKKLKSVDKKLTEPLVDYVYGAAEPPPVAKPVPKPSPDGSKH